MAETQRDYATLLANLPDNTVGLISPEDVRDAVASALGGYGGLYSASATSVNLASVGAVAQLPFLAEFADDGSVVQGDSATNQIDISLAGDYEFHFNSTPSLATTGSHIYTATLYKNGVATNFLQRATAAGATTLDWSLNLSGIVTAAASDAFDIRFSYSNDTGAAVVELYATQFWMRRLR